MFKTISFDSIRYFSLLFGFTGLCPSSNDTILSQLIILSRNCAGIASVCCGIFGWSGRIYTKLFHVYFVSFYLLLSLQTRSTHTNTLPKLAIGFFLSTLILSQMLDPTLFFWSTILRPLLTYQAKFVICLEIKSLIMARRSKKRITECVYTCASSYGKTRYTILCGTTMFWLKKMRKT